MLTLLSVTAKDVFSYIGYIIIALLALMVMIVIHESGHYLAGKLFKFNIDEFSIGFGPAIFKKRNKKNGELFAIRCIPLGGYCAFHGEDEEDEDKKVETKDFSLYSEVDQMNNPKKVGFNDQKPWKRLIVQFAGAGFNFLFAIIVISIYFATYGQFLPKVTNVHDLEGAPATFQDGDVILRINNKQVNILLADDINNLFNKVEDSGTFKVLRDGKDVTITASKGYYKPFNDTDIVIQLDDKELEESEKFTFGELDAHITDTDQHIVVCEEDGIPVAAYVSKVSSDTGNVSTTGYYSYGFGITRTIVAQKLSYGKALGRAFGFCFFVVFKILATLGALITGKLGATAVGGTITTIKIMAEGTQLGGFSYLLYIISIISANLAVFNLLPIPALDGSRMVFTTIEWIFRKPVPRKIEAIIHTVGLVILVALAVFFDIFHLVSG